MHYQEIHPHPALRAHIACYFFLQLEQEHDTTAEELIIPDGTPGLMFVQNARFTRYKPAESAEPGGRRQVTGSYVFGQKTRAVRYVFDTPGLYCFGVKFQPQGLHTFSRIPACELTDTLADAIAVFPARRFNTLQTQLFHTRNTQEQSNLLDNFFLKNLPASLQSDDLLLREILKEIHAQHGQVEVFRLLQLFQLQYKRLERLFQKLVGIGPKSYCSITRFHATMLPRNCQFQNTLTQLAYTSGYFDQMHFNKAVRHFTNLTPKEFYKNGLGEIGAYQRRLVLERLG